MAGPLGTASTVGAQAVRAGSPPIKQRTPPHTTKPAKERRPCPVWHAAPAPRSSASRPPRQAKIAGLNEQAKTRAVEMSAADFAAFLAFAAQFPQYSLRNRFLLWIQNPDATQVAGYAAWRGQGRQVRKGEKGLAILAPNTYATQVDPATGQEAEPGDETAETVHKLRRCSLIHVFDIAQTDDAAGEDEDRDETTPAQPSNKPLSTPTHCRSTDHNHKPAAWPGTCPGQERYPPTSTATAPACARPRGTEQLPNFINFIHNVSLHRAMRMKYYRPMSDAARTDRTCKYPGCDQAAEASTGPGRPPEYCDDPEHNALSAFRARRATETGADTAEADAATDRPVTMSTATAGTLHERAAAQIDELTTTLGRMLAELRTSADPDAAAAEVTAAHATAREQVAAAEARAAEAEGRQRDAETAARQAREHAGQADDAAAAALARMEDADARADEAEAAITQAREQADQRIRQAEDDAAARIQQAQTSAEQQVAAAEAARDEAIQARHQAENDAETRVHAAEAQAQERIGQIHAQLETAQRRAQDEVEQAREQARRDVEETQHQTRHEVDQAQQAADRRIQHTETTAAERVQTAETAQHHAETEASRARQAETDIRAELDHVRAETRERLDETRTHYTQRLDDTRTRAERAEAEADRERSERQRLAELVEALRTPTPGEAEERSERS